MNKTIVTMIVVSILLLFAYIIANYYTEYKKVAYKPEYVPLKFKLDADNLDRIIFERLDERMEIVKIKNKWLVASVKYPADVSKIYSLINRLNEIKEGKIVSIDPTQFDVYGVGTKTGIRTIFYNKEQEVLSVIIGRNSENNRDGSFLKFLNEDKVYNVPPLLEDEVSLSRQFWLKKELKIVEKDSIYRIIIKGESNYTFIKSGKKWWIKYPQLAPASETKIKEILDRFSYLSIEDVDMTKNIQQCKSDKPKYKVIVKYVIKSDNTSKKKKYILTIVGEQDQSKVSYYATLNLSRTCFLISSSYPEALRLAHFEIIERELIPSDLFAYEISNLEFTDFIDSKVAFTKKKVGKNDYKWLLKYKGRFKYFKYDKIRSLIELLKGIKVEDYQYKSKGVKFNRSFVLKTETKDVYANSVFYEKGKKECVGYTSRFGRLYVKLLCSDIEQVEDNLKKLLKIK